MRTKAARGEERSIRQGEEKDMKRKVGGRRRISVGSPNGVSGEEAAAAPLSSARVSPRLRAGRLLGGDESPVILDRALSDRSRSHREKGREM